MPTKLPICIANGLRTMVATNVQAYVDTNAAAAATGSSSATTNVYAQLLTRTFTVTDATRVYVVKAAMSYIKGPAGFTGSVNASIRVDGVDVMQNSDSEIDGYNGILSLQYPTTLSAASHTIQLMWKCDNGQGTINTATAQCASLVIR